MPELRRVGAGVPWRREPAVVLPRPPAWTGRAACQGLATAGTDPWHPGPDDDAVVSYATARRVCAGCPVRLECALDGLRLLAATGEVCGMWGGLTPEELRRFARKHGRPVRKAAQHGTRAKYVRGCRCEDCTAANSRGESRRRAAHDPATAGQEPRAS